MSEPDAAFAAFSAKYLAEYLERAPTRATEAGDHSFDARWPDVSAEGDAADHAWAERTLKALAAIPRDKLGLQSRLDHELIENNARFAIFAIDEIREGDWNPMVYTGLVGDGLDPLATRNFAPLDERARGVQGRLEGIPAIVAAAKKRLQNPPEVFTQTAIQQNKGLVALVEKELPEQFKSAPNAAAINAASKKAGDALKDFQAFLERDLLPRSKGDFRLGRAKFEKKLRFYLDDPVDIDAVAQGARALLAKTQDEMAETAKELWPALMKGRPLPAAGTSDEKKKLVRAVLDELAKDHPTNETIVAEAKKTLADATRFVREHDLVRVPDEPVDVIEMPEYRRGVAVAYCDSSGPLEKKPETFYTISPTPKEWDQKRADSFYREYNRSMLVDLTIHEAMPGHYLQLMHNNTFPSKVRAVFGSGPFIEGWAVYTEWLMSKYGFGGPNVRLMRQKMILRLACNAILDHDIHAGTMDEKQAIDLMKNEAFQEDGEAVGKWKRARLSSGQLTTYYYGFTEMVKLRAAAEKEPGFKERAYHDKLLSYGSPSMRVIREILAAK